MDDFISGENRPLESGVEQSKGSAVNRFVATPIVASSYNDNLDRHMMAIRELIATQVELIEKNKLKGRNVERSQSLLITLNELLANYRILRQR